MKKLLSVILVVATILSLSTSALAANPYISNPELQNTYQNNMNLYYQYEAERNALDAQFKKDNPTVNYYDLYRTSWNANVFQNWSGSLLYTNYHGIGYYATNGYTTVTDGWSTYSAIVLKSDPKPSVTATYIAKRNELTALMDKYYDAAEDDVISSIDQDAAMLQKIMNWYDETYYDASCYTVDPDKTVYLIFQLGNYMYSSGQANRSSFYYGMIEEGNRRAVPYAVNGNTMIPIRALIEGLGGTVDWDAKLNGARATLGDDKITMPIGSEYAYVNDEPVKMTTPAVIANGKTMIPVRFVAENLGYDVEWVADGQFVLIKKSTSLYIVGYEYSVPEDAYQYGYSWGDHVTWCYDVYRTGSYSEYESRIGTVNVECQLTTESDISELDELKFKYVTTTNGIKIYEDIIPREEYNGDSYDRYLKFKSDDTDVVLLVYAEYYVEDTDYDSWGYIADETRAYGDLKNDALDDIIDTIIGSVNVVWGNQYGEAVG